MPYNNHIQSNVRISRNTLILLLFFVFFSGGYAVAEEIPDNAFFALEEADSAVHEVADWIVNSGDNKSMPFVIVDKNQGKIYVFREEGVISAAAPALIGETIGDYSAPGVGDKKLCDINPYERTTPAGRFLGRRGLNSDGTEVIWIDFDTAIAIHAIPSSNPGKRQQQRLISPSYKDKRITLGCVNVSKDFYIKIITPLFSRQNAFVYILPETIPVQEFFKFKLANSGI